MKKILVAVLGLLCAMALVVSAQDAPKIKKGKLTADQQTLQKEMLAKYDTDKNGKLSKTEIAAMTQEDKDKMIKAGLTKTPKKHAAASTTSTPSTNAPPN